MVSSPSLTVADSVTAFVRTLLPRTVALQLNQVVRDPDHLIVTLTATASRAACPTCTHQSQRVQSRYMRTLTDLPWGEHSVKLQVHVRRFTCTNPACAQKIFAERLPELAHPYARRTTRLHRQQTTIAFALGGEAGTRLCHSQGLAISPDTLLRDVRRHPVPRHPTPRILGVDDWSFRRGRHMGTILVDLERRCPVDLLADSSEESFAAWLELHPGVEVISRDRGEIYAAGGRRGAPGATHIADRWHILKNLGDALQKLMSRHTATLRQAAAQCSSQLPSTTQQSHTSPSPLKPRPRRSTLPPVSAQRQRQLEMYAQVRALVGQGWGVGTIARHLKLTRITVRKYRDMEVFHDQRTSFRVSEVERYRAYLEQRWAEGCSEAKQLWLELQEQGYRGGYKSVWQFTRYWKLSETLAAPAPPPPPTVPVRTPRQAMWLLMRPTDQLSDEDSAYREQMVQQCAEIALSETLVKAFRDVMHNRQVEQLDDWIRRATTSGVRELRRFALGLEKDKAAVRASVSQKWSNGQVEGQVTKLKLVKRQMYGRAKFDLLRARVLHRS